VIARIDKTKPGSTDRVELRVAIHTTPRVGQLPAKSIDARIWRTTRAGEWIATHNGITIRPQECESLIDALWRALDAFEP